mgnify:CR=1 FL=1
MEMAGATWATSGRKVEIGHGLELEHLLLADALGVQRVVRTLELLQS